MSDQEPTISQEEIVVSQKKFSEIKHSINNALAVMMALSEMSQRRPDYAEKLATTVLTKAPQIVSSLQEFTQALNEKAGPKPEATSLDGGSALPFPPKCLLRRRLRGRGWFRAAGGASTGAVAGAVTPTA